MPNKPVTKIKIASSIAEGLLALIMFISAIGILLGEGSLLINFTQLNLPHYLSYILSAIAIIAAIFLIKPKGAYIGSFIASLIISASVAASLYLQNWKTFAIVLILFFVSSAIAVINDPARQNNE